MLEVHRQGWKVKVMLEGQGDIGRSRVRLVLKEKLLPVQDDVSSLIPNLDPPGGVLGLLVAVMVHGLGGAIGVLPPLELGCVDLPLTVAEHDGLVTIPFHTHNGPIWEYSLLASVIQTLHRPIWKHDFL